MIEPVREDRIRGVQDGEGVLYRFGNAGYVTVYRDGHVRFVGLQSDEYSVAHNHNNTTLPGSHVIIATPRDAQDQGDV